MFLALSRYKLENHTYRTFHEIKYGPNTHTQIKKNENGATNDVSP